MKTAVISVVGPILAAILASCFGEGCYNGPGAGTAYDAELKACVAMAKTREESRYCRAMVDKKYGLCETPTNPYPCL